MKKVMKLISILLALIVSTSPVYGMLILKQEKNGVPKHILVRDKEVKNAIRPQQDEEQIFETVVVAVNGITTVATTIGTGIALTAADIASRVVTGRSLRERSQGAVRDNLPSEPTTPRTTTTETTTTTSSPGYVYKNEGSPEGNIQTSTVTSVVNSATNAVASAVFNVTTKIITGKSPAQHKKDHQRKAEKHCEAERLKRTQDDWDDFDGWTKDYIDEKTGEARELHFDSSKSCYVDIHGKEYREQERRYIEVPGDPSKIKYFDEYGRELTIHLSSPLPTDRVNKNIFVPSTHEDTIKSEGCFGQKPEEVNNTVFDPPTPNDSLNSGGCGSEIVKDNKLFDAMAATDRKGEIGILEQPTAKAGFKPARLKGYKDGDKLEKKFFSKAKGPVKHGYEAKNGCWWMPTRADGSQHAGMHYDILDPDGNPVDNVFEDGISRETRVKTKYGSFMQSVTPESSDAKGFVVDVISNAVPTRDEAANAFSVAICDLISHNIMRRIEFAPEANGDREIIEIKEKLHNHLERLRELRDIGAASKYPEEVAEIEEEIYFIADESNKINAIIKEKEEKRRSNYAFNQVSGIIIGAAIDVFIGGPIRKSFGSRHGEE